MMSLRLILKTMTTAIGNIEDLLEYIPETGEMFWKVRRNNRVKAGDRVSSAVNSFGYINVTVNYKQYLYHRLAFYLMEGRWPLTIDHINHNKTDNRWANLREATYSENNLNRRPFKRKRND